MSARGYNSPRRDAEAAETRARIVDAAARLFVRDGYTATPMKAIAAEAGVSLPTVHLNGPKHALLIAAFERAFAGDEGRHSLAERPTVMEIIAEPDDLAAMTRYAGFLSAANERAARLIRALALAADADAGARAAWLDLEQRRRRDMMIGAGFFVQRGLIRPERQQWAADLLGVITGPGSYLQLVEDSGWPLADYEAWLVDSMQHLVERGRA